jgi:hypothetical protein
MEPDKGSLKLDLNPLSLKDKIDRSQNIRDLIIYEMYISFG